ncbi:MAG: hypothetical protein HY554_07925 [Elusimicrobia bacterium]|nr:hypothetical protein [Elusimicrobiota bacterium]
MPLTKESTRQLVRLQEQDKILDAIQADIDRIPKAIGEIRARIDGRKARLNDVKGRQSATQLKRKEKEAQMAAKEADIKKHGQELNQVKTNDAFRALQNQIDGGKTAVSDLETEILTLMEELDALAREEKAVAAEIKGEDSHDLEEIQAFEKDKAALEAKAAAQKQARDALVPGIPEDVLKHYEHLRKRKQGVALAPVLKNICGACRIMLPPQVIVEVTKATAISTCESCYRILYLPEAARAGQPAEAKPGA